MAVFEILGSFLLAAQAVGAEPPVIVTGARFLAGDGNPATAITYRPGSSCYHWMIHVIPQDRTITVREVFELPAPAARWGIVSSRTRVAPDRASAVTEIEDSLADGQLTNSWCVAEGDPTGPHRIIVYAGERALYEFRFNVVPAAD